MILKLNNEHKNVVMDFVSKEPSINLFIIGDIEQFGFDKDFQDVWGHFDENGNINGILLRYKNNFIPYIEDINTDISEFKDIIKSFNERKIISGKNIIIDKFKDVINNYEERITYFCELRDNTKLLPWDNSVKYAKENDAKRIHDLIGTIDEFMAKDSIEWISESIRNKSKVAYYIENEEKQIITISQISAENTKSAMVVGVATRDGYREKGLMSKCLSKLCNDYLEKNKVLCLFYDNPKAGKVYHKIGFNEIGIWTMLVEK